MRPFFLAASLALAAVGSSQTVLLRFKPPVGKTASYVMSMSMSQKIPNMPTPMNFTQTVPLTMRVVSRKGNLTTMETKMGQAKVTMPAGSPMAAGKASMEKAMSGVTTTSTVDELGGMKNMNSSNPMANSMGSGMMSGAQGVAFPAKALKVGDTWSTTLDMSKAMGAAMGGMKASGKIPVVYKLVGLENQGGMKIAKIAITMKGTTTMNMGANSMKMSMNSNGTLRLDSATGLMRDMSTTTLTDMTIPGMGAPMRQTMTMSMKAK